MESLQGSFVGNLEEHQVLRRGAVLQGPADQRVADLSGPKAGVEIRTANRVQLGEHRAGIEPAALRFIRPDALPLSYRCVVGRDRVERPTCGF